jgi:hypothetical protein
LYFISLIIEVSPGFNLDRAEKEGLESSANLTDDENYRLYTELRSIKYRAVQLNMNDVSKTPLFPLINNQSSVVVFLREFAPIKFKEQEQDHFGMVFETNWPSFTGRYTNTNDPKKMHEININTLQNANSEHFIAMSCTCTQNALQAVGFGSSIYKLAIKANEELPLLINDIIKNGRKPQLMYTDISGYITANEIIMRLNDLSLQEFDDSKKNLIQKEMEEIETEIDVQPCCDLSWLLCICCSSINSN